PDVATLGDRIAALTVAEAVELGNYLETAHGIRATPAAVIVPPIKPDLIIDEGGAVPTEFDVLLDGVDAAHRIAVIRAVREATGLGLKESRDLVETCQAAVKERLPRAEADALKARLETAGARVLLRASAA